MSEHQSKLIITPGHASHLAINNSREGQVVEDLSAVSPDGDWAVLAEALVVEAVDLGDLPRLVVSPDQGYPVWVTHLRNTAEARRWGQGYFRNQKVPWQSIRPEHLQWHTGNHLLLLWEFNLWMCGRGEGRSLSVCMCLSFYPEFQCSLLIFFLKTHKHLWKTFLPCSSARWL